MADDERIRTLLRAAAEGSPPDAPVSRLVSAGRRSVRRRRVVTAAITACGTAVAIAVPTLTLSGSSHHDAAGPTTAPTASATLPPAPSPTPVATPSAYPTTGPGTAAALAHAQWSMLPEAPIAGRNGPASAWTGTEMLLWGGSTDTAELGDGASYDPAAHSWQTLPPSPLTPRMGVASVWTGTQWFLWGGQSGLEVSGDGALYDPATHSWTPLPASPLSPRGGATAIWTGTEVIVLGGSSGSGVLTTPADGAAYNPSTHSWRTLATNPALAQRPKGDLRFTVATAAGPSLYVADLWSHTVATTDGSETTSGVLLSRYDPGRDTWTPIANPEPNRGVGQLIWTGSDLLIPAWGTWCGPCSPPMAVGQKGRRFDPATGAWTDLPHGRLDDFASPTLWTGAALVVPAANGSSTGGPDGEVKPGDAAAWDPIADKWVTLPRSPVVSADVSVWTGSQLLVWGLPYGKSVTKGVGASLG